MESVCLVVPRVFASWMEDAKGRLFLEMAPVQGLVDMLTGFFPAGTVSLSDNHLPPYGDVSLEEPLLLLCNRAVVNFPPGLTA